MEDLAHFRWGIIGCNGTELMLSESENAPQIPKLDLLQSGHWAVNFYFYPPDIKGLHAHLEDIELAPTSSCNTGYGMTEFSVQDPDGHILSFRADTKT